MTAVAYDIGQLARVEPPTRIGAYLVVDRIAEGGMALIYRGRDPSTGQLVALKTALTGKAHEVEGLVREIVTLRQLRHPGIVRLLADGDWNGLPWMALELLQGRTLFEQLVSIWSDEVPQLRAASDRPARATRSGASSSWIDAMDADHALAQPEWLPAAGRLRDALSPIIALAPVLDHLHDKGFVHRDLTPGNIFLRADGRMTLLDFGLACRSDGRRAEAQASRPGQATVEYAAPEQLCGQHVDASADIFSLGSILYELVTGRLPFDGDSPEEMAQNHVDREPFCPSDLVRGLPWQLEDLILNMLAKDPGDRPRRAGDVAVRLMEVLRTWDGLRPSHDARQPAASY